MQISWAIANFNFNPSLLFSHLANEVLLFYDPAAAAASGRRKTTAPVVMPPAGLHHPVRGTCPVVPAGHVVDPGVSRMLHIRQQLENNEHLRFTAFVTDITPPPSRSRVAFVRLLLAFIPALAT
jgi:hypothetical protein